MYLSDAFLKNHSTLFCQYIALQTMKLRNLFLIDHPAFTTEMSIAKTFYRSCKLADGNPYTVYFARQLLCSDLEKLYASLDAELPAQPLHTLTINTSHTDTNPTTPTSTTPKSLQPTTYTDICPSNLQGLSPLENTGLVRYIYNPDTTKSPQTTTGSF